MARSCGIRIGPRRYELVVLEGGAKKHRIAAFEAGELPTGGEDPFHEAVTHLKRAVKAHKVPLDNVGVCVDTGLAAFRTVRLPFEDAAKIEEVIKFEVESQLPQFNIDDVVVDFLSTGVIDGENVLLVTAVPKRDLSAVLELCQQAGLEPNELELEATAMANASISAGICTAEDAQLLVHIGDTSTSVVVIDGGRLHSIRAIHLGALSYQPHVEPAAALEEGEEAEPAEEPAGLSADEIQERIDQLVSRLRRELVRSVSGAQTHNPIEAVYVCGQELPGLVGSHVLEVPVYELDVFEEDVGQPRSTDVEAASTEDAELDGEPLAEGETADAGPRPAEGTAPLVVAYGAALRQLGGGILRPSLRREDLRFTGKFERVELPVAMASVLLVTLLGVFNIFEHRRFTFRDRDLYMWIGSAAGFMQGDPKRGIEGNLGEPVDAVDRYLTTVRSEEGDPERSRLDSLGELEWRLDRELEKAEKALGKSGDIPKPMSALEAVTLVFNWIGAHQDEVGRISVHRIDAQYRSGRGSKPDTVEIITDMTFFAESGTEGTYNFERFESGMDAEPWCVEIQQRGTKTLEENKGIYVEGMRLILDLKGRSQDDEAEEDA